MAQLTIEDHVAVLAVDWHRKPRLQELQHVSELVTPGMS